MTDEEYRQFKADAEVAMGFLRDIELDLQTITESPQYDEAYKLGPQPDLQSVKDATEHLKQAQARLAQFFTSTTNYPCRLPHH